MNVRFSNGLRIAAVAVSLGALSVSASAYSAKVESACRGDYFAHCSQYSVGTPELSQCMRRVGEGLSLPCLAALADDGQISKAEIDAYYTRQQSKAKTGAQRPTAVAAAKATPASKAASLTKPGAPKTSTKALALAKAKRPAATYVASASPEDATKPAVAPAKKVYGDKKGFGKRYLPQPASEPRVIGRPPQKTVKNNYAVVAKATRRGPRDDDGWYDDNYFPAENRYVLKSYRRYIPYAWQGGYVYIPDYDRNRW